MKKMFMIVSAFILVALLSIVYMIATAATRPTDNNTSICVNNTSTAPINIVDLINRFKVEEIVKVEECVYIRGRIDFIENDVHVVVCGKKVYIFAEVQVPPPPP